MLNSTGTAAVDDQLFEAAWAEGQQIGSTRLSPTHWRTATCFGRTCKPQRQLSSSHGARALCVRCLPTLLILLESSDLGVLSWSADRGLPAAEPPRRLASLARSPQPNATRTQTPRSARRQSPTHRDRVRSHTHLQAPARPQSHPRAGRPDAQREQRPRVVLGSFRFPQRVSRIPTNATPARR
jgi:hypothetical protein